MEFYTGLLTGVVLAIVLFMAWITYIMDKFNE